MMAHRLKSIAAASILVGIFAGCSAPCATVERPAPGWAGPPAAREVEHVPETLPAPVDVASLDTPGLVTLATVTEFMDALAGRDAGKLAEMLAGHVDQASLDVLPTVVAHAESTVDQYAVTAVGGGHARVAFLVDGYSFSAHVEVFPDGTVGDGLIVPIEATVPVVLAGVGLDAGTGALSVPAGVYHYVRGTVDAQGPIPVRLPIPARTGAIPRTVPQR